jgi:ribonuclease BN (tRNA processing enzyme)
MFELTVLGKYGPYPKRGGATTSYLLKIGDKKVVLDMGTGSLAHLQNLISIDEIDAIFLTHLHHDHMVDALILRYALTAKDIEPIPLYTPDTPSYEYNLLAHAPCFDTRPITESVKVNLFGAEITFKGMIHPVVTYAIKIIYQGKTFVFSSDTVYNPELSAFAENCDLLLCDSAFPISMWKQGFPHPSAVQAGVMGNDAHAKQLILTHINPEADEKEILKDARNFFPKAEVAEEMKTYII